MASLSSADEDSTRWDLASEPHVTRLATTRLPRSPHSTSSMYSSLADDESSDSSTVGFAEGCGLQGTFQSTDRIRIRWAKPIKPKDAPEAADGRRRVGVREVAASSTCVVLGNSRSNRKGKHRSVENFFASQDDSIAMRVEYSATCKGIWFPGVATMLGMDVGLDAGDCDVEWAPGGDQKWTISGDPGYTGFAIGPPPTPSLSRRNSDEIPSGKAPPSTPVSRPLTNGHHTNRPGSPNISLMRAPLPEGHVEEYSFEASPSTTPTSSIGSLATIPSSPEKGSRSHSSSLNGVPSDTDIEDAEPTRPPKAPITVHVNMNDLLPSSSKSTFTFHISGTIVVRPRKLPPGYFGAPNGTSRTSSPTALYHRPGSPDSETITLPQFRVLYCDRESGSTLLRNDFGDATLDVYNPVGRISDPQSRKTVLQPGGQTKCGLDGARIVVRPSIPSPPPMRHHYASSSSSTGSSRPSRTRRERDLDERDSLDEPLHRRSNGIASSFHMNQSRHASASSVKLRETTMLGASISRPRRDGPLMIHSVVVTITPTANTKGRKKAGRGKGKREWKVPKEYAVRVCLPVPADADSDWVEFGLALPLETTSDDGGHSSHSSSTVQGNGTINGFANGHAHANGSTLQVPTEKMGMMTRGKKDRGTLSGGDRVRVASASVESVPVKFETYAAMKPHSDLEKLDVPFEGVSGREWNSWVKVHVGEAEGGMVEVVYLVDVAEDEKEEGLMKSARWKGKEKERDTGEPVMDVLLPIFSLPVGRLEVHIEAQTGACRYDLSEGTEFIDVDRFVGCEIASLDSNLTHQQIANSGSRLMHYSMEEFFEPKLTITFEPPPSGTSSWTLWKILKLMTYIIPTAMVVLLFVNQLVLHAQLSQANKSLESHSNALSSSSVSVTSSVLAQKETVTIIQTSVVTSTLLPDSVPPESESESNSPRRSFSRETLRPSSPAAPSVEPASSKPAPIASDHPSSPSSPIPAVTPPSYASSNPNPNPNQPNSPPPQSPYHDDPTTQKVKNFTEELTLQQFALEVLMRIPPIRWSTDLIVRMEVPRYIREPTRDAFKQVVYGFGVMWRVFSKAWHYPVYPP